MDIWSKKLFARILPVEWVQPTLSSNGTPYVDKLATSSNFGEAWMLFDNKASTTVVQYGNEYSTTGNYYMFFNTPVKITKLSVTYGGPDSAFSGVKTKKVQVYKNNNWVNVFSHTADNGYGDGEPQTKKDYECNTDGYYQAYRLVTITQGSGHWDMIIIREIDITAIYEDRI